MYESSDKMVSHPDHYMSETGLEVIDVIEAFTFDLKGIEATDTGNILKYMCRWKNKNGLQDLEKAKWFANRFNTETKKGYVQVGIAKKEHVLAYFNTRGEDEIVYNSKKLDISILKEV